MATVRTIATRSAARSQSALEAQLAELRQEIDSISKGLKARGIDLAEQLGETTDDFASTARRNAQSVVRQVQHEASVVADAVREHPVSTSAAISAIVALGFAVGYMLAATADEKKRFW